MGEPRSNGLARVLQQDRDHSLLAAGTMTPTTVFGHVGGVKAGDLACCGGRGALIACAPATILKFLYQKYFYYIFEVET